MSKNHLGTLKGLHSLVFFKKFFEDTRKRRKFIIIVCNSLYVLLQVGPSIKPLTLPMACNLNGFKLGGDLFFRIKVLTIECMLFECCHHKVVKLIINKYLPLVYFPPHNTDFGLGRQPISKQKIDRY